MDRNSERPGLDHGSLRSQWRDLTMRDVWRHPGDWAHPAADAFVEALESGQDPLASAERLGAVRARSGTGITEAIDDVACLYRVLGAEPPLDVVRAVSAGWVSERENSPAQRTCIEPVSGLFSSEYLSARLRETYNDAICAGTSAAVTHGLLMIDVGLSAPSLHVVFKRAALVGTLLRNMFGDGFPMANLTNGIFAVLLPRDEQLGHRIGTVRRGLELAGQPEGFLRVPPRLWIEPLPSSVEDCSRIFDELGR